MTSTHQSEKHTWLTPVSSTTYIISGLALIVFGLMILLVANHEQNRFDEAVFETIFPYRHNGFTRVMRFVSFLGNTSFLLIANGILVVFFVVRKDKWTALRVAAVGLSSVGLMSLLKTVFHRHRPSEPLIEGITNFSFPSGHAFMTVAFYGLMICWVVNNEEHKRRKNIAVAALLLIILLIGFSRVYLRVHYSTDVMAGWGMSTAWLILVLLVMDKILPQPSKN